MSKEIPRYVIGIDPAGNHPILKEGDGTTGIVVFDTIEDRFIDSYEIKSKFFKNYHDYHVHVYSEIYTLCTCYPGAVVSIEDYLVYPSKAIHHTFSRCPTSMLLGYLLNKMYEDNIDYYIRPAVDVKNRWSDEIMFKLGYIEGKSKSFEHCHGKSGYHLPIDPATPLLSHHLDAMRHALHCAKLELPKGRGRLNE